MEFHAILGNVPEVLEAPHLESAAVSEHWAVPAHELLHATRLCNQGCARTQVQVVSVREDNLRFHFSQVPRREPLHARQRPHWHKNWRLDVAMGRMEPPPPCLAAVARLYEFKGVVVHGNKDNFISLYYN